MVTEQYTGTGVEPQTPLQALIIADAHIRALGYPHLSPLDFVKSASEGAGEVTAGLFTGAKLTFKELLPGLKLRTGSSEIEIVRVRPTEKEVTYKTKGQFFKIDAGKFLQLANQQGYRKVWDFKTFLATVKTLLKPVLAAVPLMWVLKLITNAVRKRPMNFEERIHEKDDGKLSSLTWDHHHEEHKK